MKHCPWQFGTDRQPVWDRHPNYIMDAVGRISYWLYHRVIYRIRVRLGDRLLTEVFEVIKTLKNPRTEARKNEEEQNTYRKHIQFFPFLLWLHFKFLIKAGSTTWPPFNGGTSVGRRGGVGHKCDSADVRIGYRIIYAFSARLIMVRDVSSKSFSVLIALESDSRTVVSAVLLLFLPARYRSSYFTHPTTTVYLPSEYSN